jgi:hypothetical protein
MNSLPENAANEKALLTSISSFCKEYSVGRALKKANAYKTKGTPVIHVFTYLLQLVYTKKSMYMNILNGTHEAGFGRNVVYRLLNSSFINWSTFLLSLAIRIITDKITGLTSDDRTNAMVVDDTLYSRPRSKHVELLAKVHDHTGKGPKFRRGFRQLTLAWTDGCTLIPLLFRHLSSEDRKNRYNEINPGIDKRSCGYKARLQAVSTGPKVLLEMLAQAVKYGIPSKHVLFDCWFSFPVTIMGIAKLKLQVIARLKKSPKIKYLVDGDKKTLCQIYSSLKKRRGKSKYLLSVAVKLYNKDNETLDARIVYVRDRNNKKNWIALISTDMNLTEEEIIQLYGKRWDIEVFFKVCKSYLNLGREFQGLSYDAITAHTAVVLTRYMILALEKRQNEDPRALGELFFLCYDEVADIQFSEALELILSLLRNVLEESVFLTEDQIRQLIDAFILKLPEHFKAKMGRKKVP